MVIFNSEDQEQYIYSEDDYDDNGEDDEDEDEDIDVSSNKDITLEDRDQRGVCLEVSNAPWDQMRIKNSTAALLKRINTITKYHPENLFQDLLDNVFKEGFVKKVYLVDLSFTDKKGKNSKCIGIRPQIIEGDYLYNLLGEGRSLRFVGRPWRQKFEVYKIMLIRDDKQLDYEVEAEIIPYKDPKRVSHSNLFAEILENTVSLTKYTKSKLEDWEEYLDWLKQLAQLKLTGCKYYKIYVEPSSDELSKYELVICLVMENEDVFKKIRKYLSRGMMLFDNNYSLNEWEFKFAGTEDQSGRRNYFDSTPLGNYRGIAKQCYLNGRIESGLEDCPFENPYIVYVKYNFDEDTLEKIEKYQADVTNFGSLEEYINENILPAYVQEGFLALSGVQTFTLIQRFNYAITKLKNGEYDSPNLPLWLFDARKARIPGEDDMPEVKQWLDSDIASNEQQKIAVQKILAAPDLCLVQGPPGTGKTTVIAEAIYQLALQGKRVLLASQSNDAVDNALDRLKSTPVIRAIRLQNSRRQYKDEEVSKFAEDTVLRYFYHSLADSTSKKFLDKWKSWDEKVQKCQNDLRDAELFNQDLVDLLKENAKYEQDSDAIEKRIQHLRDDCESASDENGRIGAIKQQQQYFHKLIVGNRDEKFTFADEKIIFMLENTLNPLIRKAQALGILPNHNEFHYAVTHSPQECESIYWLIYDIYHLQTVINKFNSNQNVAVADEELDNIEREIERLYHKLADVDDIYSDEGIRIHEKLIQLKYRRAKLQDKGDNVFCREEEKGLFKNETFEKLQNKQSDVGKSIGEYVTAAIADLVKLDKKLAEYVEGLKLVDVTEILDELKVAQGQESVLRNERKELQTKIASKRETLHTLQQNYNAPDDSYESVCHAINEQLAETENNLKNESRIRDAWERILSDYRERLLNEGSYIYDKDTYQPIYTKACNVVGTSCTANMRDFDEKGFYDFDVAIIDEVSKATPPELLLPMMRARKAALIGDHRQLPPTFGEHKNSYEELVEDAQSGEDIDEEESRILSVDNFDRFKKMVTSALFKEYFEQADPAIKHRLNVQYRMHREIMDVINRFYENQLEAGLPVDVEQRVRNHGLTLLDINNRPYIQPKHHAYWIDSSVVVDGKPVYETYKGNSSSACNFAEQQIIVNIVRQMAKECAEKKIRKSLGIISFYQMQVNDLRRIFKQMRKEVDFSYLKIEVSDINTVDRFQGKEKNIIITSLVRNPSNHIRLSPHALAFERINVAFSRAQELLVIVGAQSVFAQQEVTLPAMDVEGTRTVPVYRNIIEYLNNNAALIDSARILTKGDQENILKKYNEVLEQRGNDRKNNRGVRK